MGMHKYCSDPDPKLYCTRSDPHLVVIVETCVTGGIHHRCWRDRESDPCPGKNYMCPPTIKTFLDETSLDPFVSDKRKQVDYRGSCGWGLSGAAISPAATGIPWNTGQSNRPTARYISCRIRIDRAELLFDEVLGVHYRSSLSPPRLLTRGRSVLARLSDGPGFCRYLIFLQAI
jgi:hypothetical protein